MPVPSQRLATIPEEANTSDDSLHRYSMPVTRSRSYINEHDSTLDSNNTTGFLFGDEDSTTGEAKNYQQSNHADVFPTFRNSGYSNMVRFNCLSSFFTLPSTPLLPGHPQSHVPHRLTVVNNHLWSVLLSLAWKALPYRNL
jgi:hypothetical protein